MAQEILLAGRLFGRLPRPGECRFRRPHRLMGAAQGRHLALQSGVIVEQSAMDGGVGQALFVILAMDHDQGVADPPQQGAAGRLVVDEGAAPAVSSEERRDGKECVRTGKSRGSPSIYKK